jgi:hypothetical protein
MSQEMKFAASIALTLALAAPAGLNSQNTASAEPVTWGALSGNTGCVIFAEGHKTSGRFYGIAVTTKTVGKLTLVEAQNYTFDQKEVLETDENMNNLMQIARKDHVKFIKIPEKYSPELLEKARVSCKPDAQ